MFTEWVTAPRRIIASLSIEPAWGVPTENELPYDTTPGAEVISGRGASSPEPSSLNR